MKKLSKPLAIILFSLFVSNLTFSQETGEKPSGGGNSKQQRAAELKKKKRLEAGYKLVEKEEKKRFKRQSKETQKQMKATKKKSEKAYKKRSDNTNRIKHFNNNFALINPNIFAKRPIFFHPF